MLHSSKIHLIVKKGEFSLRFIAADGNPIVVDRCICTSFHSSGRTMNIKLIESQEIRKVRRCTITHINEEEICL